MANGILERLSSHIVRVVDRYLPEPFAFAIVMTFVTVMFALAVTPSTPVDVLVAWGDGLAALLPFIAQMSIMVLLAYGMAHLGPIPALLEKLASRPQTPRGAYVLATLFTGFVSLVSWPLGLILGGLLARAIGRSARRRGVRLHYPLLGGAAFSGFVVWHMGYSASAPLFVATPGNSMQDQLGALIPVSATIFSYWNIAIAATTLTVVAVTAVLLHPKNAAAIEEFDGPDAASDPAPEPQTASRGPAERLETSRIPTLLLGLLLCSFAVHWFATKGLQLDLNIVNWTFLAAGLLLARSTREYSQAIYSGGRAIAPILLQYPLYGGIMGIMLGTGSIAAIAPVVTRIATQDTLPVIAFLFGGLVNLFIPSGGAQWAVQGPTFIAAAQELGTDLPLVVMGVAYGDQWTNIIHPFTVIVLLIMTGLKAHKVIAYSAVMFLAAALPLGFGLYLVGALTH